MNKISITIDLGKLDKSRVVDRKYTDRKTGQIVTVKELKLDIVSLREPKVISSGVNQKGAWQLVKTHFVAHLPNEQEKMNQTNSPIVGEGTEFQPVANSLYPNEPIGQHDDFFQEA